MNSEAELAAALNGHYYVMTHDFGAKVVDTAAQPKDRHVTLAWTDEERRTLWQLKRRGCTVDEIEFQMGRDRRQICQVWGARRHWKDKVFAVSHDAVTLEEIRRTVCNALGVGKVDFTSERRMQKLGEARQVYYWIARKFTKHSLPKIGQFAGDKDHSTVVHGIHKVEAQWEKFRARIELVLFDLGLELPEQGREAA